MKNKKFQKGSIVDITFNSKYRKWIKSLDIQIDNQDEYNNRLDTPINGTEDTFRKQIGSGQGSELKEYTYRGKTYPPKFWNGKSSSRICFELYSWIVNEPGCLDFSFEKKLPAINSSSSIINSNMDVYIKSPNDIWFIESKFTESPENISDLAEAYYQTRDENKQIIEPKEYYKETYYRKVKPQKGADPYAKYSLIKRYFDRELVMKHFVEFIKYFMSLDESEWQSDWFDTKQETCHLLGIIMYMIDNKEKLEGKTVNFRNIVFNRGGCKEYITKDKLANHFMEKARAMVQSIMEDCNIKIPFTYEALSIQDVLKEYGDKKAYACEDKTVIQSIKDNFKGIEKFL